MAAMARCRICKTEFALARLLDDWNCCCPSCDAPLAPDGPTRARLLRKAAALDRLEAQLVDSLSEIAGIDSEIEFSVGPIVAKLLQDVDWQRQLQRDLSFAQRQVDYVRNALSQWANRNVRELDFNIDELESDLPDDMHELAHRLRKVGDSIDNTSTTSNGLKKTASTVRAAATSLDNAAGNLADGRGRRTELDAALNDAIDAIATTREEREFQPNE
jgi:hypothetical protein